MENQQKYRPNVAAVILNDKYPFECKFFIARRSDMENIWQFPQGGIDIGEDAKIALFRELKEEIGTNEVEIIAEYPKWINYDFPPKASKKYNFLGQSQRYFLVRLKAGAKININTKHAEFDAYQFVNLKQLFSIVTHFKKPLYEEVLKYFKEKGYL